MFLYTRGSLIGELELLDVLDVLEVLDSLEVLDVLDSLEVLDLLEDLAPPRFCDIKPFGKISTSTRRRLSSTR